MSKKYERINIVIEEAKPVSLKIARTSRGQYRWEINVKDSSIDEVEEKIEKLDEWCRMRFTAPSTDTIATASKQQIEAVNPIPAPVFNIRYKGHILGKIILEKDKTFIRISDSVKIKPDDPAIKNFLIPKAVNPILERYQTTWNPIIEGDFLKEIVINHGLHGEDVDEFIRKVRWAITRAYARPLQSRKEGKDHG